MLFDEHRKGIKHKQENVSINKKYYADLKSGQPELVFKVASNINHKKAQKVIDYIARNKDEERVIAVEDEMGNQLDKEKSQELSKVWEREFESESQKSRKMTHFIISVDVEKSEKNEEALKNATRDFLRERLGDDGFRYVFVLHKDTEHLHAHIVVNNNNRDTGKKLRINKEWLQESRVMIKESLSVYGIEQSATLRKDKQLFDKKIDAEQTRSEREFNDIGRFVDAKLKGGARNESHFQHIKNQFELLCEVRRNVKERSVTQQSIELRAKIRDLHKSMVLHSKFNSESFLASSEANKSFLEVMKESRVTIDTINKSKNSREKGQDKIFQQQNFKLVSQAKSLVEIQHIIKISSVIDPEQKKEMMNGIKERKGELVKMGVDMKAIEKQYDRKMKSSNGYLSMSEFFQKKHQSLERLNQKDPKEIKELEKHFVRTLNEIKKSPIERMSKKEIKDVSLQKAELIERYKQVGVDVDGVMARWHAHQAQQIVIKRIKEELKGPENVTKERAVAMQKELVRIREQNEKEGKAIGKKEQIATQKSVSSLNEEICLITGSSFPQKEAALNRMLYSLKSLDKKIAGGEVELAARQQFALAKGYLKLEKDILGGGKEEKVLNNILIKKLQEGYSALLERGVKIEEQRAKQQTTQRIESEFAYLKGIDMKSPGLRISLAQEKVDTIKSNINKSDMSAEAKKEIRQAVYEMNKMVATVKYELLKNVDAALVKMNALDEKINHLKKANPETPSGRLYNSREIEACKIEIGALAKEIQKSFPSIRGLPEYEKIKKAVGDHLKHHEVGQGLRR